jgi:hypothetical protein
MAAPASSCDLYLGDDNSRCSAPYALARPNPAIVSGDSFTHGMPASIVVKLQNDQLNLAASGQCTSAQVDLYWADPTASLLVLAANQIASSGMVVQPIGPATTLGGDAAALFDFSWTPPAAAASTNSGHVCLVAIAHCNSADCFTPPPILPGSPADPTSPLLGIRCVQVN